MKHQSTLSKVSCSSEVTARPSRIAVIGGGPAGLYAAEIAASGGAQVTLFDAKPSVGRKFLIAGRGGLNLTNAEENKRFASRYIGGPWPELIQTFDSEALRHWAAGLGCETFVASTGRVYPKSLKAAPLLRAWVQRLRDLGVAFRMHHRWNGLRPGPPLELLFDAGSFEADAAIFALGGGSWPQTGSDGGWTAAFQELGVDLSPLVPANCGWEVEWPATFLKSAEGLPIKNLAVTCGTETVEGELLITSYGLEGGAIYKLGPHLRAMEKPSLLIDLKPSSTLEQLLKKAAGAPISAIPERWRLGPAAAALLQLHPAQGANELARLVKALPLSLRGPRPLREAISSAGGVRWESLSCDFMVKAVPGVFVAGEMIDWEAPTGGYLIQGCFATGALAAKGALAFASH